MSARAKNNSLLNKSNPGAEMLIKEYENDCRLQGLARDTIKFRGYAIRNFARFLEARDTNILDVNRDDIRAWVEELRFNRSRTLETTKKILAISEDSLIISSLRTELALIQFQLYKSGI
jgi:hypothetical protein